MTIESVCSGCGKRLAVDESSVGKQIRCPACGAVFRLETPSPSLPVATPISTPSPEQQVSDVPNALNINPVEGEDATMAKSLPSYRCLQV